MKQKIDTNLLASSSVFWWSGERSGWEADHPGAWHGVSTGWHSNGHGSTECLYDGDDDCSTIVRPPTISIPTLTPGASPPYTPRSRRSPVPHSPSRSRPSSSGRSSQYSSGRMSPVCESPPPPLPPNPPPPLPSSRPPLPPHYCLAPTVLPPATPPSPPGDALYATLPLSREDRKKSMALTSIKKDKHTYIALPPTDVLQGNVYSSLRPKKSMSFASLKHYRASREVATDPAGPVEPLQYRARSHDELRYVSPPAGPSDERDPYTPQGTPRGKKSSYPKEEDPFALEDKSFLSEEVEVTQPEDALYATLPPCVTSQSAKMLPRAKLRRRSIAVANEFSLVCKRSHFLFRLSGN